MEQDEFTLDVRLVPAGPATDIATDEDRTSDNCGETPGSAGIANCPLPGIRGKHPPRSGPS